MRPARSRLPLLYLVFGDSSNITDIVTQIHDGQFVTIKHTARRFLARQVERRVQDP